MESIYAELALSDNTNECARTDIVIYPYLRSAMVRFPFRMGLGCYNFDPTSDRQTDRDQTDRQSFFCLFCTVIEAFLRMA